MQIHGTTAPGFDTVRAAFAEVLAGQPGTGASFAAWHDGEWVVDLWGGYADAGRTRPWQHDTLVMPYSVTKPFAALCVLLLAERGLVELDAPMRRYWPELVAEASVRDVLSHRAGLVAIDEPLPAEAFLDWDRLCAALARQSPAWPPGTAQGESALFYGHLLGQVVRRVDGRTLGRFLREDVCGPLGIDFHIGLTDAELARAADLTGFGTEFTTAQQGYPELYARALGNPAGALDPGLVNSEGWRRAEVPAINGHGTARAVAEMYVALAQGRILGPELLAELTRGEHPGPDLVVGDGSDRQWGLGVAVDPDGYGMGGTGGSFGWWCASGGYAAAFLTGHIGGHERGDRIEGALRHALGLAPL